MKVENKTWLMMCICILMIAVVLQDTNGQRRDRHRTRPRPPPNRGRPRNDARRRPVEPQGRRQNPETRSGQTNRNSGDSVFGSFLDFLGISTSSQGSSFTWSIGDQSVQVDTNDISEFFGTAEDDDDDDVGEEEETPVTLPAVTTTQSPGNDLNRPWRGEGSFTGDIRLGCMDKKCVKGVPEIFDREHNTWGLLCGNNWGMEEARVVCNYLQFSNGARRALSLQRKKIPEASRGLAGFFSNVECSGEENTITECNGERLETGECERDRIAAVTCAGKRITSTGPATCGSSKVLCGNRQMCVPPSYSCDGMADCPWGTDEENCGAESCPTGSFRCRASGNCITTLSVCDGTNDCPDGSDESSCEDHLTHFRRKPEVKLPLGKHQYNTGWHHVSPYVCAKKCREEKRFQCAAFDYDKAKRECYMSARSSADLGLIIPSSAVRRNWFHFEMKRINNCRQFVCGDQCISTNNVCDGTIQCLDGTDEQNCEPERADIPVNAILRLAAGPSTFEGRLEISGGDSDFGLICDVGWTIKEANVACRQLGFRRGAFMELTGQFFSRTNLGYKLSGVRCRGTESSLRECRHEGWNLATCNMDHEAGVVCKGDLPATPASIETTTQRRRRTTTTTMPPTTTTTQPVVTRPLAPTCGNMPPHEPHIRSRVVGGLNAGANEWPWQVGIWLPWQFKCGGSLIDSCWVLTAAHCFTRSYQLTSYTIRLGDHQTKVSDRTEQDFKIRRIIAHSGYSTDTNDNDIALLQLQPRNGRCAVLNEYVKPVCVPPPSKSFPVGHKCYIIGWGQTYSDSKVPFTDVLQEATVPLIDRADCIRQSEYKTSLTVNMLCAGYMHGGVDTCQGDSGGPLLCYDNSTSRYYVWGVVSWGHGCARPLAPGVYTKVNNYHRWITSQTGLSL